MARQSLTSSYCNRPTGTQKLYYLGHAKNVRSFIEKMPSPATDSSLIKLKSDPAFRAFAQSLPKD